MWRSARPVGSDRKSQGTFSEILVFDLHETPFTHTCAPAQCTVVGYSTGSVRGSLDVWELPCALTMCLILQKAQKQCQSSGKTYWMRCLEVQLFARIFLSPLFYPLLDFAPIPGAGGSIRVPPGQGELLRSVRSRRTHLLASLGVRFWSLPPAPRI